MLASIAGEVVGSGLAALVDVAAASSSPRSIPVTVLTSLALVRLLRARAERLARKQALPRVYPVHLALQPESGSLEAAAGLTAEH